MGSGQPMRRTVAAKWIDDSAGMTLVELMIAASVIAMALIFALGSIINISETSSLNADQVGAAAAVSSLLEELRAMPFNDLLDFDPLPPVGATPGTMAVMAVCFDADGAAHALPYDADMGPAAADLPNPLEVQVTVTWQDRMGRPMQMRSSSLYLR